MIAALLRHKRRTVLVFLCVVISIALLVYFFGIKPSKQPVSTNQPSKQLGSSTNQPGEGGEKTCSFGYYKLPNSNECVETRYCYGYYSLDTTTNECVFCGPPAYEIVNGVCKSVCGIGKVYNTNTGECDCQFDRVRDEKTGECNCKIGWSGEPCTPDKIAASGPTTTPPVEKPFSDDIMVIVICVVAVVVIVPVFFGLQYITRASSGIVRELDDPSPKEILVTLQRGSNPAADRDELQRRIFASRKWDSVLSANIGSWFPQSEAADIAAVISVLQLDVFYPQMMTASWRLRAKDLKSISDKQDEEFFAQKSNEIDENKKEEFAKEKLRTCGEIGACLFVEKAALANPTKFAEIFQQNGDDGSPVKFINKAALRAVDKRDSVARLEELLKTPYHDSTKEALELLIIRNTDDSKIRGAAFEKIGSFFEAAWRLSPGKTLEDLLRGMDHDLHDLFHDPQVEKEAQGVRETLKHVLVPENNPQVEKEIMRRVLETLNYGLRVHKHKVKHGLEINDIEK